jgi:HAD superfamily hydrolase (TIGR01450 family)
MHGSATGFDEPLRPVSGFIFDLDGTLILSDRALGGYTLLPGAVDLLGKLRDRGAPFAAFTNGSAWPPAEQAAKLRALGLPIEDEQMITPSVVAAELMRRRAVGSALVLGTSGVGHALAEAGFETRFTGDPGAEQADAVYIGWHPECGMKDIEAACRAIWNGAALYVASDVPFFATSTGKALGYSHAIAAAVRKLTRAPMILTGKPSVQALRFVARRLGVRTRDLCVVGDDPLVEMIMARRGGAIGIGVTTGTTSAEEWAAQPLGRRPHRVVECVGDVLGLGLLPA